MESSVLGRYGVPSCFFLEDEIVQGWAGVRKRAVLCRTVGTEPELRFIALSCTGY